MKLSDLELVKKLKSIADTIRSKKGIDGELSIDQIEAEYHNIAWDGMPKTLILRDEAGNEMTAVLTDEEVELTATPNDIRAGKTAVTVNGVEEGTKVIPSYHTRSGAKVITAGKTFSIGDDLYDYDMMQAIICSYNTNLKNSVAAVMVSVNNNVYTVGSTEILASIEKDHDVGAIKFGISNSTDKPQILRYMFIKEIY